MARPRTFDAEQVADALLQVFWRRGYAGTSISDLSAATGLGPASLYAAFGNKEKMFRHATDRYRTALEAALSSDLRGLEGVQALFAVIINLTVNDPERRGCLVINAIPEASGLSEDTRRELQNGLSAFRLTVRERLREAVEDSPQSRDIDVEALSSALASMVTGIRVLGRAGQSRRHLQSIADGAMSMIEACFYDNIYDNKGEEYGP